MTTPNQELSQESLPNPFDFIVGNMINEMISNITLPITIVEDGQYYIIYVDIPGIDKNTITIKFDNNKITLSGERKAPGESLRKNEIQYGKFSRTIKLPFSITDRENVSIEGENGVLKIQINREAERRNVFSLSLRDN